MQPASMQDWFEINSLFTTYAATLDRGDVEGFASLFREGAWIYSPVLGRFDGLDGVRAFAERTANVIEERGGQFRHVVTNLTAMVDGDRARASCYLLDFYTEGAATELLSPGVYDCELSRVDGRWLFDSRAVAMDKAFDLHM